MRYDSLPGPSSPATPTATPTRDEVVAYLNEYAREFEPTTRHILRSTSSGTVSRVGQRNATGLGNVKVGNTAARPGRSGTLVCAR